MASTNIYFESGGSEYDFVDQGTCHDFESGDSEHDFVDQGIRHDFESGDSEHDFVDQGIRHVMASTNIDFESGGSEYDFVDKGIRHGFIKKVYGLLTIQLAVTIGIISLFYFVKPVKDYVQTNEWVFWTPYVLTLVIIIALACVTELRRQFPINIICLMIFTVCEGVLLGVTCSYFDVETVLLAVGMCGIIVLGLTIFAFQTKIDFTLMSGLLCSLLLSLVIFGMFAWMDEILYTFYAALGACVFSMFIVFDTQLLVGGSHKYTVSPEEYVFAALNLYVDIVTLFLYLLMIFSKK